MQDVPRSVTRQLFSLAAPIIGINVLNVLMLAVDSALCGRLPESEDALKALGFAVQVIFLLMVAMLGLLVGTVALVSRAYGGGDRERVNHLLVQSTMLTASVGIVIGIVGAITAPWILTALGAGPDVVDIGTAYLRPLMVGTPFFYLTLLYTGILRGVGNTRIPFICALIANVINAVLNYTLVLGHFGVPSMGVTGSAIGTVIAQLINLLILVYVLRRGHIENLELPTKLARVDRSLAVELFRIGWPAGIDMLVLNAGFLTAIGMLGRLEPITVAAHGLGMRVQSLAFVPGLSIAQATAAMVGQALGGGNVPRVRQIVRGSMLLNVVIMGALAIIIIFAATPLVAIFDVKPASPLEHYSVEWMRILGYAMLPSAIHMAMFGLLQGSGATRTSLRINIWTTLVLQVPLAWLFGFPLGWGPIGVWMSFPVAILAKAVIYYIAFKREKWAVTGVRLPKPAVVAAEH